MSYPRATPHHDPHVAHPDHAPDGARRRTLSGTIRRTEPVTREVEPRTLEGLTVLVVDDHEDTRTMFAEYLGWHGAHPIPVDGVKQALTVLEAIEVDVVITDVAMPQHDGYELIARMDAHPVWSQIARVIASGQSSPEEADDRAPGSVYLCKPIALDDLVRAVELARGDLRATGHSGGSSGP